MQNTNRFVSDYDESPGLALQHFKVPVIITVFGVLLSSVLFMWSITADSDRKKRGFAEASNTHVLSMKTELKSLINQSIQFSAFFKASYHVNAEEFEIYASQLINTSLIGHILYFSEKNKNILSSGNSSIFPSKHILKTFTTWRKPRIEYELISNSEVIHVFIPIKKEKYNNWLITTIPLTALAKISDLNPEKFSGIKIVDPISKRTLHPTTPLENSSLFKDPAAKDFSQITAFIFKDTLRLELTALELIYSPAKSYLSQEQGLSSWIVLIMGLILTSLLSIIYFRSTSESLRINKEAKHIATKFHNSEVRLSHVIDQAVDAIITLTEEGIIENTNPACKDMFGYSENDLVGNSIDMLFRKNNLSENFSVLKNGKKIEIKEIIGETKELNATRKNGQDFPIELSLSEIRFSDKRMLSGFIRDISDRKKIIAEMENAYKKLTLVTDGSKDGFWHWINPEKDTLEWSDTFFELLGYKPQEFAPSFETFQSMLHPDDIQKTLDAIDNSVKHKHTFDIQYRIQRKNGVYYWYRGRGTPYYNDDGDFMEMAGSISDIEHIKVLENTLRNTNSELEQFAYIASHDLKEPVRTLNTFSTYLLEDFKNKKQERIEQDVKYIQSASARMTILIDDLLELSRAGNTVLNKTRLDLTLIIEDVKNRLLTQIQETGTTLDLKLSITEVLADPTSLGLVIQNLLQNAIKFQDKDKTPHIVISTEKKQSYSGVIIHIKDNGIGIEESQQETIFGVFKKLHSQTDYPGTGIGLTIVTKIIERHGGHIKLVSTPKKGSCFSIYLPHHS